MNIRGTLFQARSVVFLSVISFVASISNQRLWDDEKLLGTRLAPELVSSPLQFWHEPYWHVEPQDGYRPTGLTVLYAERILFGESMIGFRLVSLLLHGLVALALLRVLRRIAPQTVAWVAVSLFAIHPAHAEAVVMAYGQLELLAALFALLAIDRYLVSANRPGQLTAALVFAFLAASSKESGLMLPALLVLIRGLYLKPADPWRTRWFAGCEALFVLPGVVYLVLRQAALGTVLTPPESTITYGYSTALHFATVIVALGNAIRLSVFPTKQTLYYGHLRDHLIHGPWTELAWIGAGTLLCWVVAREIGSRAILFSVGWFLVTLFPVLNIVPSGVLVAERNLYLPLAGVAFLAASFACRLTWNRLTRSFAATLLVLCITDSNLVARQWRDNVTLWRTTVSHYPRSPMAHAALGDALLEEPGRDGDAERHFRRALALNPEVTGGKLGLAQVAMRRGQYRIALAWFEEAQRSEPSPELVRAIDECKLRITAEERSSVDSSVP